jgi:hypothetical protein
MKRVIVTAAIFCHALIAVSQTGIPSVVQGLHGEAISLSGDIGTYGELYSISGRDSRRPSSTARLFFRPTISLYDAMTLSFNFLLSTEGNSRSFQHQVNQINQFGVNPRWAWGYANAGDFTETFTPYTLNGILIRGGGISINPGLFRFSAVGGFTRRSGFGGGGGFDRYLYGGKIGIGRDSKSYLDVLFVRTRDIPSRFQIIQPDSIHPPDSTLVGNVTNPYQETPQENLVVGIAGALKMFENVLALDGEISGSAFTRDMNSTEFNNDRIPSFVRGIYTPRLSSNADYAYTVGMNLNLSKIRFKASYRRIGPGYNSLGVASLITDVREIKLGTQLRFSRWSTGFTWTRQNDNLLDQKLNTTIRQTFAANASVRPLDAWSTTVQANVLTLRNYAGSDADLVRFATLSFGTSQSVLLGREAFFQTASLSYMFQKSADDNPLRANNGSVSHAVTLNTSTNPFPDLTVIPSASIVASRVGQLSWATIQTYSITSQYRMLENSLMTSLTVGLSNSEAGGSVQLNAIIGYRFTRFNTITLSVRTTGFNSNLPATSGYSEHTASLTMSQKI